MNILEMPVVDLVTYFGSVTEAINQLEIAAAEQGLYEDCFDEDPLEENETYGELLDLANYENY